MDVAARAIIVFLLVLVITRAVGRRELSSMEPFDLIMLVVIGDLIQQGVTQSDYSLTGTLIVMSVLATLTVLTSYASFRFPRLRSTLEGEPIVLLERGRIIERNMRRERMTNDELASEARLQQISDLRDVHLAILETNGKISFIERAPKGPAADAAADAEN
ncbi:MAG TPA: YetF domain-containing protein [Solirubrobacteraceae bacterium]|nr:YetF domain-containing protein [Solirubrobacteraceae bacterium]